MARMKTFLMYLLILIGFMFLSYVLENGLLSGMYDAIIGTSDNGIYSGLHIRDLKGSATNVNGYLAFSIKNRSSNPTTCYGKIDLYNDQDLLAATEYIEIPILQPDEEKNYQVKFKANNIASYEVSLVSEVPDKTNIISIFGWEVDLTNVFGMDLSNAKIFGIKLTELFNWNNIKAAGGNVWSWVINFTSSVPWWGYAIGAGIILWYMPKGFLFGVFPF